MPHAVGYTVSYTDTTKTPNTPVIDTVSFPEYSIADKPFETGEHEFRIRALGNIGAAIAAASTETMSLTAYNSSLNLERAVALTYYIDDDPYTTFVSVGDSIVSNLYDPGTPDRAFVGWYYDAAFTKPVQSADTVSTNMTVYAKFEDTVPAPAPGDTDTDIIQPVTEKQSFWAKNKWIILGVGIGVLVLATVAGVITTVRKKK